MMPAATFAAPRLLALCADDYGMSPGVNAGIIRLAKAGRLSAVSCMTSGPQWSRSACALRGLPATVDLGLHLNLTEGIPLSRPLAARWRRFPALAVLIAQSHLGLLPLVELQAEIQAQWQAFGAATGAEPAHVDGHQHVHHLPGVRDIVLRLALQDHSQPAVRNTAQVLGPGHGVKRWLIRHTGGRALERELQRRQIPHNPVLLGAYDFRAGDFRLLMQRWLAALPAQGGLLYCHPAFARDGDLQVAFGAARRSELLYLASDDFLLDLAQANIALGRVWLSSASGGEKTRCG